MQMIESVSAPASWRIAAYDKEDAVRYLQRFVWEPLCQESLQVGIKPRGRFWRKARGYAGAGANAPAPCLVRVPYPEIERDTLDVLKPR
jgi:hypothetical protein